jgi:hypothetical protein
MPARPPRTRVTRRGLATPFGRWKTTPGDYRRGAASPRAVRVQLLGARAHHTKTTSSDAQTTCVSVMAMYTGSMLTYLRRAAS